VILITLITLLIAIDQTHSDLHATASSTQSDHKIERALLGLSELSGQQARIWATQNNIEIDSAARTLTAIVEPASTTSITRLSRAIRQHWGEVEATSSRSVRAVIPFERAHEIASLEEVQFIRRPLYHRPLSLSSSNRGVLETGGSLMHAHTYRGDNVIIAVIDNGFEGLSEALRRGIIPEESVLDAIDYEGDGLENDSSHGLEVAQIAYEMAPDAKLILMNIGDEVDLENAVNDAINMGARVINHSVGWFNSNFGDGTGPINELVERARNAGVLWVNAAGNQAASHWMGSSQNQTDDGWIEFAPGVDALDISMQFPGQIDMVLVWNEFPVTREDYDFYLTDWQGTVVASSEERQTGSAPPSEELQHFVEQPGLYKIKVRARQTRLPTELKIFVMDQVITPAVAEGSIVAPADCTCALAVGAISITDWHLGFIEYFSAQGPTTDGRIKPDLVAPDGIRGLNGTSFSAPSVAGAAALLISQNDEISVDELMSTLMRQTFDIYAPGKDNITGYGKLELRLDEIRATRTLSASEIRASESLYVTVEAMMPRLQFGRFELFEEIPLGFDIEIMDANGGQATIYIDEMGGVQRIHWIRELVGPGDRIALKYQLRAVGTTRADEYVIEGELNGQSVDGESQFELIIDRNVASPNWSHERLVVPVVNASGVHFLASPRVQQTANSIRVQVLNLHGEIMSDSGWVFPQRITIFVNEDWPSGVYLYIFMARDRVGDVFERTLKKFHVLKES